MADGRFHSEWNSTMMSISVADRGPDLAERLQGAIEIDVGDVRAIGGLGVGVERPDLHAGDALVEQAFSQLVGPVDERVEVLVRSLRFAVGQAPVVDRLTRSRARSGSRRRCCRSGSTRGDGPPSSW